MKGYKAFGHDLTCRGHQFVEGQTHTYDGEVRLCRKGFHFCTVLQDVVNYYHKPTMRVFEVEASGTITDAEDDCTKRACSEIRLIKELSLDEVRNSINNSKTAYWWARDIGDADYMKQFVTCSAYAYWWVNCINENDRLYFKDKGLIN